jgi:ubiquinone/menaquinone biosynthesis C-methylase UbiE
VRSSEHWEREAERWAAWAREPGHDSYWNESGPPFFDLLPRPGRRTLDLGCGEGRVARDLEGRGHHVVGIDSSPTMIRLAREADPIGEYLVGDAASLPFDAASFDLVVAFNSLMDVDDMPGAVREACRVVEPGGRFCVCVTHPMRDAGEFRGAGPDAAFVIAGPYLGKREFGPMTIARGGHEVTFAGWTYSLEDYMRAFEDAGFLIEAVREPPDPGRPLPNFLLLRAVSAH